MKKYLVFLLYAVAPVSLYAGEWQVVGTRPTGMGGAFVAVARGPAAQYWNPGALAKTGIGSSGTELPIGVNVEFTGDIMKDAGQIGDMASKYSSIISAQKNGTKIDADQLAAFAKTISLISGMNNPGKGALAEVAVGLNSKYSKVAVSVNSYVSLGVTPHIDTVNIGLGSTSGVSGISMTGMSAAPPADIATRNTVADAITAMGGLSAISRLVCGSAACITGQNSFITDNTTLANALYNQAIAGGIPQTQITEAANTLSQYAPQVAPIISAVSSGNAYTNNNSNLGVSGGLFIEIAGGYARNVDKLLKGLSLGGNFKLINGQTLVKSFQFLSDSHTANAFDLNDLKSSWRPAIDLGALWEVNKKYPHVPFQPRVGLVMRNINGPSFDAAAGSKYDLDPQIRMGFAVNPYKSWTVALDIDLTNNKTPVDGFTSREFSLGTEINVINRRFFTLPLRAGLIKNIAEGSSRVGYTFGTGLNIAAFHFDVSGVISSESTEIEKNSIPTKVGAFVNLGLLF
jgi:hypothetical protein